jgi:hypothetical protein
VFVVDVIEFKTPNCWLKCGQILEIYMQNNEKMLEIQCTVRLSDIPDNAKGELSDFHPLEPENYVLLCWKDLNDPDLYQVSVNHVVNVLTGMYLLLPILAGHLRLTDVLVTAKRPTDEEQAKFIWQHPATKFARQNDVDIVMAPISLFSDETSGNKSKMYNNYESCSITFSNMPLKIRATNKYSSFRHQMESLPYNSKTALFQTFRNLSMELWEMMAKLENLVSLYRRLQHF